jgi:hypothetical protein
MKHLKKYWIHYFAAFFWIVGALVYVLHLTAIVPIEPFRFVILALSILIISLVQYHEYKR